jgi:hypothetical protein
MMVIVKGSLVSWGPLTGVIVGLVNPEEECEVVEKDRVVLGVGLDRLVPRWEVLLCANVGV